VKNQSQVIELLPIVEKELKKQYLVEVKIREGEEISFRRVAAIKKEVDDSDQILQRLTYMGDINVKAYGFYINGKRAALLSSEQAAEKIINKVLSTYAKVGEGISIESIGLRENVKVEEVNTRLGSVELESKAKKKILTGNVTQRAHLVEPGETLNSIAEKYDVPADKIQEDNPNISKKKLPLGETIIISEESPMLTVDSIETANYIEKEDRRVITKNSADIYKGDEEVLKEGRDGQIEISAKIKRENGKEVSREILSSRVLVTSKDRVVLVGTKDKPPTVGSGELIHPFSQGTKSSPFGMRWGAMHNGIDFSGPAGAPIKAADGGKVYDVGYMGARGNTVMINHGNGMITVYQHLTDMKVKKGDLVFKGEVIGTCGSTGFSTGNHLHFEVWVDMKPVDPAKYL
ncbi:MAG: peptidoglycan DD-metalloendopeptidase family protein, partial [Anaerovoracaceae bacterium]